MHTRANLSANCHHTHNRVQFYFCHLFVNSLVFSFFFVPLHSTPLHNSARLHFNWLTVIRHCLIQRHHILSIDTFDYVRSHFKFKKTQQHCGSQFCICYPTLGTLPFFSFMLVFEKLLLRCYFDQWMPCTRFVGRVKSNIFVWLCQKTETVKWGKNCACINLTKWVASSLYSRTIVSNRQPLTTLNPQMMLVVSSWPRASKLRTIVKNLRVGHAMNIFTVKSPKTPPKPFRWCFSGVSEFHYRLALCVRFSSNRFWVN